MIMDVCYGSDDKLALEDDLLKRWPRMRRGPEPRARSRRFWTGTWFDREGKLTPRGITRFEWGDRKSGFVFKHHRYRTRYQKIEDLIRAQLSPGASVDIYPIALGVAGWVPGFTKMYLEKVFRKKGVERLEVN